jgi:mycofactocin system creatininase family protein
VCDVSALAVATSPEVRRGSVVVIPVGSLEQHGPHLPLHTDTVIASTVAAKVADQLGGWCAPPVAYGSSGEHQSFPGTTSIGTAALETVLIELARSLRTWARRVLLVNGHGGNVEAVRTAVSRLVGEGHDISWVPCAASGMDAHAGRAETSLMLHLRPDWVRMELAEAGNTAPLTALMPHLRLGGMNAVSHNGVLGDPRGATAAEGEQILDELVANALASVRAWT